MRTVSDLPDLPVRPALPRIVDALADGGAAVLVAPPGSGKTHLCTAMCGKLLDAGLPVRYVQWRSDIPAIKAKANDAEAYKAALDPLKSVRVLYIDDFLKGAATEADRNIAFDLLNARYIKPDCVTILSSERSIGDVIDWDEAVGSRIAERAAGNIIAVSGRKNWRMK